MVDVGIQSESEEFNDTEMNAYGWNTADRKPSFLQVVPEEEHEDDELEMVCLFSYWRVKLKNLVRNMRKVK